MALTFRWKESQSINRKHPHQYFGCAIISTARRGGQKSYSAGLGSELLINYLGSCALFETMPTQMWSEISQLCLVTIDTQAAHTILSGRQCLACSLATRVLWSKQKINWLRGITISTGRVGRQQHKRSTTGSNHPIVMIRAESQEAEMYLSEVTWPSLCFFSTTLFFKFRQGSAMFH